MFRFFISLLVLFYLLCFSGNTILVHDIVMMSCGQLSGAGEGRSFALLNSVPSCTTVCSLQLLVSL